MLQWLGWFYPWLTDNVILATEKGYNRKAISTRCMIKVDLRKAYECPFLRAMLVHLGFPLRFVYWIMACVQTVSYSVLINGKPSTPFAAKKGLRQGYPLSPFRDGILDSMLG